MLSKLRYALFGILSALAGMGVGHLVAALTRPEASPEVAVGETVIDHTPTPVKNWAIAHFGTHDKTILVGSVLVVVLLLAAVAGLLARRAFRYGAALLVALVAVALYAALTRPVVEPVDALPAVVTAAVGVAALWLLTRLERGEAVVGWSRLRSTTEKIRSTTEKARSTTEEPRPGLDELDRRTPQERLRDLDELDRRTPQDRARDLDELDRRRSPTTAGDAARASASRRGVLIGAGGVAVLAAATGYAGRAISRSRAAIGNITLPRPQRPAPAFPRGLDAKVPGITPFRTPTADFYRVDTRLSLPLVDASSWRLQIDGDVAHPQSFGFDDLLAMPLIERDITLTCVSNDIGGPYISGARWLGVPLKTLLDRAGVGRHSDQILSTDVDGMTISTPLALATDGRDAMIAVGMNGGPLPRAHGFPARMVVPGLYGFISACKWINRMTLTTYAGHTAYWTDRGWSEHAPIKIESRIDTPGGLQHLEAGPRFIGGIAWAQPVGVAKVEVQVDGGPWQHATLGPSAGNDYWRQWYLPWHATSGQHQLACRATDRHGNVQTPVRTSPFPDGASGIQKILVSVT